MDGICIYCPKCGNCLGYEIVSIFFFFFYRETYCKDDTKNIKYIVSYGFIKNNYVSYTVISRYYINKL